MPKILFFGDIMGKPGRKALAQVLPQLREQYHPDIVIANVENLAHGKGVTLKTLEQLTALGVDVFTSGNHVFDKAPQAAECFEKYPNLIRPANYLSLAPADSPKIDGRQVWDYKESSGFVPGVGYYRFAKNNPASPSASQGGQQYLIVNLGGQVFFEKQFSGVIGNPFFALDEILQNQSQKDDIIIVDFHAEATSEKIALGWYADGRVTALFGTHTHVPTADWQLLPQTDIVKIDGRQNLQYVTAYVTDVGMTGAKDSVIGVKVENALNAFLGKDKFRMDVAEDGPVMVNALLVETDGVKAKNIERIYKEVS